jgi:hypothetical protein
VIDMGVGRLCYFGFSVSFTNSFSEYLEGRNAELELALRSSEGLFGQGLRALHDGVDAALAGDAAACAEATARALSDLQESNEQLTAVGRSLVESRGALFERSAVDPADPLIARERHFTTLDYDAIYRELAGAGAVLPERAFWADVVLKLRRGGMREALRLLDRQVRELQTHLRGFVGLVEGYRGLSLPDLGPRLHGTSIPVATMMVGYARLSMTLVYLSILCERATMLHEREQGQDDAAVAV